MLSPAHDISGVGEGTGEITAGGDSSDSNIPERNSRQIVTHLARVISNVVCRTLKYPVPQSRQKYSEVQGVQQAWTCDEIKLGDMK